MKIYSFFYKKLFFRRLILTVLTAMLLLLANYVLFTAVRSIYSTVGGYREAQRLNQSGTYIANLDPESSFNIGSITESQMENIYNYLNQNFSYAFFTDGLMVSIPNDYDMEISLGYMNEAYYRLNQFELRQEADISFDYPFDETLEIPVIIGAGLAKNYPVGAVIKITDPTLNKAVTLKVQGVLKTNSDRSNLYALDIKNYYNFSILIPVNRSFLKNANLNLKLNALMDLILLQTNREEIQQLDEMIEDNIRMDFNFFSQEENYAYFNDYYLYSLKIMSVATFS